MSLLRLKSWPALAAALVLTLTSVASAQKWQPFGPVDFEEYHDRQPFAPPDVSSYDLGPPERNGFFVTFERLYLSIGQPDRAEVGAPGVVNPNEAVTLPIGIPNSLDTSWINSSFTWANRIEGGWREDKHGWLATGIWSNSQWQALGGPSNPAINFEDPLNLLESYIFGFPLQPFLLPPEISAVEMKNVTRFTGVELLHTYRFDPGRYGGEWELFCGARYLQFNDEFDVVTHSVPPMSRLLDGSFWNTLFQNNLVGPEIGLRMANRRERWTFVAEGRFTAAANFIDGNQNGAFFVGADGNLLRNYSYLNLGNTAFSNTIHQEDFSPIVELRLESSYELTKAIAFKFGYTAIWIDNIARASNRVLYRLPDMGFNDKKLEDVLINGVTFGIEINR